MTEQKTRTTHSYVQPFDDGRQPALEALGGKGASLVSMTAAEMPVPPGFVVTTSSFDAFLEEAGIAENIHTRLTGLDAEDVTAVDTVSAAIRDELCSRPVPTEVRAAVVQAYTELMEQCGGDAPVAVRSSATAEDLPDASFAGQQDTYLWLNGLDAVTEHIRKCWASLYTSRAIIYRLKNGIPNEGLSMAVVVQKMVNARVAGVAITMNPATGDRSKLAIDASWGVGEMVVSGRVTPDHLLLDKITLQVVAEHIGDKHAELVPNAATGTLVEREVSAERAERRCLTDEELAAVAQMAKRAEKHYECPQDIEWALDADLPEGQNLLLLQSRPETVHSSQPQPDDGASPAAVGSAGAPDADTPAEPLNTQSFPKPSDLPVPEGAEGWEQIYPYYLVFQEQLREVEDAKFWFCDSQHWPTVFKPFETIGGEFAVKCLGQYNARHLMIPNANGIDFRIHLGYLYMSPLAVPEDEVAARVPEFEARIGHYFQNWEALLSQWQTKVRGTIDEMETLTFDRLPAMVPMEDIVFGKAKDGSEVLMENYDRLIQLAYQNWQYHFEFLNLGYIAYLDFFNHCKELFPDIPDQSIATMVQGVDMELFRPDDELKQLAALAVELGLQEHFANTDDAAATLEAISGAQDGAQWMRRWDEAHDPWFNFTIGNGFYAHDKYWNEHPEIPLGFIADYIRRLDEGQQIMRPTEELIAEKDRIVSEYRELLDPDQQATFDAKRELAATAYPYVENHNFYIEHWTMGVFWRKVRELARTLVDHGVFEDPEDLLYLNRNEIRDVLFDLVTSWGVGSAQGPIAPAHWPPIIAERRRIVEALKTARPQPALNTPPAAITEPFTRMLWGITTEQVESWLSADDEENAGTLKGMAASPGVVEGIARVVTDADQLAEVQQDEILVAPITAPSWGPIFGKIKATVTDIGGMMSHAAIVCREYALPAVTGTGSASTTIYTGQRLRVDGTTGVVEVLDDAGETGAQVTGPGAHSHAHDAPSTEPTGTGVASHA